MYINYISKFLEHTVAHADLMYMSGYEIRISKSSGSVSLPTEQNICPVSLQCEIKAKLGS